MKKLIVIIIGLLFIISLVSTEALSAKKTTKKFDQPSMIIGGEVIKLEIADTEAKRKAGLMARKSMPDNAGMFFIFDEPSKPVFWMKDCYFPLDIIFIRNSKIVHIYTSVPPCKIFPCELYPSVETVDSALEVKAGFVKKHKIKINDKIILKGFRLE